MSAAQKLRNIPEIKEALEVLNTHMEETAQMMIDDPESYKSTVTYMDCLTEETVRNYLGWWCEKVNIQSHKTGREFRYYLNASHHCLTLKISDLNPDPEFPDEEDLEEFWEELMECPEEESEDEHSE